MFTQKLFHAEKRALYFAFPPFNSETPKITATPFMLQLILGYENIMSFHHMPAYPQILLPTEFFLTISVKALTLSLIPKDLNLIFTQYFSPVS